ncbi:MAG TPA: LON peptidase substrate-binding domain-containing protein [Gemmataceae bacterium]|jgi:Lon protease-like protein|nr:LON peptidase substrate-binding domain-containing protein [Gemmataceae bacterium]
MNEDRAALQEFNGLARLFPLPGLVLFPHVVQPLHLFEQRYRDLAADALASDRLIAPVLLRPGWESEYDHAPAIYSVACLGRIVIDQLLSDGRYKLVLRGLARVRILEEPLTDTLYRIARVQVLGDGMTDDVDELMALRAGLADLILPRVSEGPIREQLSGLFKGESPLGQVCDILAFALPLPPDARQGLLEALDVTERARLLMEAFRGICGSAGNSSATESGRRFPPDFSVN